MVRRRSTVRFRKGAPGHSNFSNTEPLTSRLWVAFWVADAIEKVPVTRHFMVARGAYSGSTAGKGSLADFGTRPAVLRSWLHEVSSQLAPRQ